MPDDIVSVRGLVDSEFGTPLRRFYGVLDSYYPEEQKFGTVVVLHFKDVEVADFEDGRPGSVEPYNFPIATISIKLSNKKKSGWGVFGDSLAELLPPDQDIKDCVGKRMGLFMEEGHVYGQDRQTGDDLVGNPWHAFELEGRAVSPSGAAMPTAKDRAKELLTEKGGKTRAEFNKAAYADPLIRKDTALQRSITDKSFINSLVQLGEVAEDENGVFQRQSDRP